MNAVAMNRPVNRAEIRNRKENEVKAENKDFFSAIEFARVWNPGTSVFSQLQWEQEQKQKKRIECLATAEYDYRLLNKVIYRKDESLARLIKASYDIATTSRNVVRDFSALYDQLEYIEKRLDRLFSKTQEEKVFWINNRKTWTELKESLMEIFLS